MLKDYLKAGYPAIVVLTQELYRAQQLLPVEGWDFYSWDCIRGIRPAKQSTPVEEIRDPVMAINWLNNFQNRVLITENLHLFLTIPEVLQSISNGVLRLKSTGCRLVMVSPILEVSPEVEKLFTVVDLPLPGGRRLGHCLQRRILIFEERFRKGARRALDIVGQPGMAALSY